MFWGNTYFWKKIPNVGTCAIGGKKETCRKRRKNSMKKGKKHGMHADRPNLDRVRGFDKYCNDYKPIE